VIIITKKTINSIKTTSLKAGDEVQVNYKGKKVKGNIIGEIRSFENGKYGDTYYKIGTHLGIIHLKKNNVKKPKITAKQLKNVKTSWYQTSKLEKIPSKDLRKGKSYYFGFINVKGNKDKPLFHIYANNITEFKKKLEKKYKKKKK